MFGRGKPQNGVIIEPEEAYAFDLTDEEAVEKYLDFIWYLSSLSLFYLFVCFYLVWAKMGFITGPQSKKRIDLLPLTVD